MKKLVLIRSKLWRVCRNHCAKMLFV